MNFFTVPTNCSICGGAADIEPPSGADLLRVKCSYCGQYEMTGSASARWNTLKATLSARQLTNAHAWIQENQGVRINSHSIERLLTVPTPTVGERAEKLLKALTKAAPEIGLHIPLKYDTPDGRRWLSASSSSTTQELRYLVNEYLVRRMGWLQWLGNESLSGAVIITPDGYEYLEQLRKGAVESSIGFCAMWFADDVKPLWTEAIEPAIQDAGYGAIRIDGVQHNNKIDDEILANIRRAKFVVADFTGHRGGVYFEAGFALGLGRQVIWTVRKDALKETHFDNRQYNFLQWKLEELADFRKRLQLRIEATIGRGPL